MSYTELTRCPKCGAPYTGEYPERFLAMHEGSLGAVCDVDRRIRDAAEHETYWRNERVYAEQIKWDNQSKPCSGKGYSHKAHGACPGWATDRT